MKKRRNKKGFTLVELLVVIGIIAVLAVVSVVGYFGFIKKANLSNDQSSITQMNLGLQADAVDKKDGKYTYAGDAVQALYSQGWNKGKMEPYSSNYKYAYSIENNKMYLLDESDNVIFPETKDSTFKSTLWGFYCNGDSNGIKGISNYVALDNIDDFACFNNFTLIKTKQRQTTKRLWLKQVKHNNKDFLQDDDNNSNHAPQAKHTALVWHDQHSKHNKAEQKSMC